MQNGHEEQTLFYNFFPFIIEIFCRFIDITFESDVLWFFSQGTLVQIEIISSDNKRCQNCSNWLKLDSFHIFCSGAIRMYSFKIHKNDQIDSVIHQTQVKTPFLAKTLGFYKGTLVINCPFTLRSHTWLQFISHFPSPLCTEDDFSQFAMLM